MRRVSSREVFRSSWMTVREDEIRFSDGSTGAYGVVDKPDFAVVIPEQAGGYWLVEQYRYPIQRRSWELPQGSWSSGATGTPEDLARTELAEETGFRAGGLRLLGYLHEAPGFSSQGFTVWLATDLRPGPTDREPAEADMRQQWVAHDGFEQMIHSGEIVDAASIAAYALLMLNRQHEHD